ncbi:hypothetical protein [Leucobacter soli]|uniref:hypothetical protein n=1 Tax=Leucobacter soli TaxID=2812850 RepID=UPI00360C882B
MSAAMTPGINHQSIWLIAQQMRGPRVSPVTTAVTCVKTPSNAAVMPSSSRPSGCSGQNGRTGKVIEVPEPGSRIAIALNVAPTVANAAQTIAMTIVMRMTGSPVPPARDFRAARTMASAAAARSSTMIMMTGALIADTMSILQVGAGRGGGWSGSSERLRSAT